MSLKNKELIHTHLHDNDINYMVQIDSAIIGWYSHWQEGGEGGPINAKGLKRGNEARSQMVKKYKRTQGLMGQRDRTRMQDQAQYSQHWWKNKQKAQLKTYCNKAREQDKGKRSIGITPVSFQPRETMPPPRDPYLPAIATLAAAVSVPGILVGRTPAMFAATSDMHITYLPSQPED